MSALDGWIDILRTGTFRDMSGREATFSAGDLDALATATLAADPVPVVVGHPEVDAPAWAWVQDVRRIGDRLQARLRDVDVAFRTAVESGRYTGRSVALVGADGAMRIRHLGFLGGRAPAVEGLAPTQFAGAGDAVRTFAVSIEESWGWDSVATMFRRLREWIISQYGVEAADQALPHYEIEQVTSTVDAPADAGYAAPVALGASDNHNATDRSTQHPNTAGRETDVAGGPPSIQSSTEPHSEGHDMSGTSGAGPGVTIAELADRMAELDAREAKLAAREARRAAAEAVAPHVEAGRVLPAERAGLETFLAALPAGDGEGEGATMLVFAGADGAEVRTPPRQWFLDFVAALPRRVDYRELAVADTAPPAGEGEGAPEVDKAVAREAREYIRLAAARGEAVTITEAVDVIRAQRARGGQ